MTQMTLLMTLLMTQLMTQIPLPQNLQVVFGVSGNDVGQGSNRHFGIRSNAAAFPHGIGKIFKQMNAGVANGYEFIDNGGRGAGSGF